MHMRTPGQFGGIANLAIERGCAQLQQPQRRFGREKESCGLGDPPASGQVDEVVLLVESGGGQGWGEG